MDKHQSSNPKKKYKRKKRKLSTSSMNFELESIREDQHESRNIQGVSVPDNPQQPRSTDSMVRLTLPENQSESENQYPIDRDREGNVSVIEQEELSSLLPNDNLQTILGKGNTLSAIGDTSQKDISKVELAELVNIPKRSLDGVQESGKFLKIYEPDKFFQEKPDNKMLLLYPFLLSKHYVDSVRRSNIFSRPHGQHVSSESQSGIPPFRSQLDSIPKKKDQNLDSNNELLSETQKCRKISKKLRRAWNLNQQIAQNVFKKVTILYNSEFSESDNQDRVLEKNQDSMFLRKYEYGEENRGSIANIRGGSGHGRDQMRSGLRRKNILKKIISSDNDHIDTVGRTLRKTTRMKKEIENKRLMRQEKNKQRRTKNLEWNSGSIGQMRIGSNKLVKANLLKNRRKYEKVEFLDYANKNIRKKKKEDEDNSDDEF